ncbi:MAG: HAD hydrolase family protein [Oscillospiraceae bacterium]
MEKRQLPSVGLRMVKTAAAVFITLVLSHLRPNGMPLYAALAAMISMQTTATGSLKRGVDRAIDTLVGASIGLLTLMVMQWVPLFEHWVLRYLLIALVTITVIYVTLLLRRLESSYFTWVVFLWVVLFHGDLVPWMAALNRVIDTLMGIAVSYIINGLWLPRRRTAHTLYVASFDNVLGQWDGTLPHNTAVRLNRLLEKGLPFTVATHRTPTTLLPRLEEAQVDLPLVVMNGAAVFDPKRRHFSFSVSIPYITAQAVAAACDEPAVQCYQYAIRHGELHVYCAPPRNDYAQVLDERLRRRQHQSYVPGPPAEGTDILFLFIAGPPEDIYRLEAKLRAMPQSADIFIRSHESWLIPGFANIEISSVYASKANAVAWLMEEKGYKHLVAFGRGDTDKSMLEAADEAYVMADSSEAVKAMGLPVAGSTGDDVVKTMGRVYRRTRRSGDGGGKA